MIGSLADLMGKLVDAARGLPAVRRDHKRKQILRTMLEDPTYEWREIVTLARAAGASEEKTRELLISIGARAAAGRGREVWGLISRVGASGVR